MAGKDGIEQMGGEMVRSIETNDWYAHDTVVSEEVGSDVPKLLRLRV